MEELKIDTVLSESSLSIDAKVAKVMETPNFKLGRILGKFVILEVLVFMTQFDCFEKLWSLSFRARSYLIKNFRFILNRLLNVSIDYHLDFTKDD